MVDNLVSNPVIYEKQPKYFLEILSDFKRKTKTRGRTIGITG